MKILNVWCTTPQKPAFFNPENLVFELGDYKIFKQYSETWLYTYKNIGINQLAGLNKAHIIALHEDKRPEGQLGFLFDRAKENKFKGILILESLIN